MLSFKKSPLKTLSVLLAGVAAILPLTFGKAYAQERMKGPNGEKITIGAKLFGVKGLGAPGTYPEHGFSAMTYQVVSPRAGESFEIDVACTKGHKTPEQITLTYANKPRVILMNHGRLGAISTTKRIMGGKEVSVIRLIEGLPAFCEENGEPIRDPKQIVKMGKTTLKAKRALRKGCECE